MKYKQTDFLVKSYSSSLNPGSSYPTSGTRATCPSPEQNNLPLTDNGSDSHSLSKSKAFLCVCTCCHNRLSWQLCVLFKTHNYDFKNLVMAEALSKDVRYKQCGMQEFICKDCHCASCKQKKTNALPSMSKHAVASPFKGNESYLQYSATSRTSAQLLTMYTPTLSQDITGHMSQPCTTKMNKVNRFLTLQIGCLWQTSQMQISMQHT